MEHYELLLLAVALGTDAFTVAVSEGIRMRTLQPKHAIKVALLFGLFQAAMPAIGYLLGISVDQYIENVDHWVALGLLSFIGARMMRDSAQIRDDCGPKPGRSDTRTLLVLALATSVDALAAGVSLAIQHAPILPCAVTIGAVTAVMCFIGVMIGHRVGCAFQKRAEFLGGVMLILIGIKIVLEHLLPIR
ncbi:MAG TPA: manganese efflux pump MntP family protein [Feifaniaceae bacterium]|nr:manganese efflux pump MntP family protein [Feifaniaceae bacterium]